MCLRKEHCRYAQQVEQGRYVPTDSRSAFHHLLQQGQVGKAHRVSVAAALLQIVERQQYWGQYQGKQHLGKLKSYCASTKKCTRARSTGVHEPAPECPVWRRPGNSHLLLIICLPGPLSAGDFNHYFDRIISGCRRFSVRPGFAARGSSTLLFVCVSRGSVPLGFYKFQ